MFDRFFFLYGFDTFGGSQKYSFKRRKGIETVLAVSIRAWRNDEEIARVNVAVSRGGDYYPIRDAVMAITGVDRVEVSSPGQRRKVYVPAKDSLFGVWEEEHE